MLKKIFIVAIVALCWVAILTHFSGAQELSAKENMTQIWSEQYPKSLKTEVFFGKEVGKDGRDVGAWIDHETGEALICIGYYNEARRSFVGRSGCTLYEADGSDFGYRVYVTMNTGRRAKVKTKAGDYDSLANETQMNYFDIVRSLFRENPDDFEFSFAGNAFRALPRNPVECDYTYRIFHLETVEDGNQVIVRVEYFHSGAKPEKVRKSEEFLAYQIGDDVVWRPDKVSVVSEDSTVIEFTERHFNVEFGELGQKGLKNGRPSGWR